MTLEFKHDPDLFNRITDEDLNGFYDAEEYAFLNTIEESFEIIADEWQNFSKTSEFKTWPETHMHSGNWKVIPLILRNGVKSTTDLSMYSDHQHDFPGTIKLLKGLMGNNIYDCLISKLGPHSCLHQHRGVFSNTLTVHIGIDIPTGDCCIKVDGETRSWARGKTLIFDDRTKHEVWNNTNEDRVILMFAFVTDVPGFTSNKVDNN